MVESKNSTSARCIQPSTVSIQLALEAWRNSESDVHIPEIMTEQQRLVIVIQGCKTT